MTPGVATHSTTTSRMQMEDTSRKVQKNLRSLWQTCSDRIPTSESTAWGGGWKIQPLCLQGILGDLVGDAFCETNPAGRRNTEKTRANPRCSQESNGSHMSATNTLTHLRPCSANGVLRSVVNQLALQLVEMPNVSSLAEA